MATKNNIRKPTFPGGSKIWTRVLIILVVVIAFNYLYATYLGPESIERAKIPYSRFKEELKNSNIFEIEIAGSLIKGEFKKQVVVSLPKESLFDRGESTQEKFLHFSTNIPPIPDDNLMDSLESEGVLVNVKEDQRSYVTEILIGFLPWLLLIGFFVYLSRRMQGQQQGIFDVGRSRAKLYTKETVKVKFNDVAGLENPKRELIEVVEFLKNPNKFKHLGGKVPKGVLIMGSPGTGKTLLARAVAGEAGVPFFSLSGSEFVEMFVGVGASRVRDLFRNAKKSAPSIIFIDEIDAVGRSRGTGLGGSHDEREQTLNQLLSEMDGFSKHEEVIVIAATNRPDVLDPALLRPGRFDRQIIIERPGLKAREEILKVHARGKPLGEDVDLRVVARGTPGASGADLENLINEAALLATRKEKKQITMEDFEEARDKILMGTPREEILSDKERKLVAYHEAGHAILAKRLSNTDPIHKVSIIPRGRALGVTQQLPEEDKHNYPKSYLIDRMTVLLGGRAAETLVFGEVTTGAQNDLKEVTNLARKMICQWGMSDELGPINYDLGEEHVFLGKELGTHEKKFSEESAAAIDRAMRNMIEECNEKAEKVLRENRKELDLLAEELLEREELTDRDINELLGEKGERKDTAGSLA